MDNWNTIYKFFESNDVLTYLKEFLYGIFIPTNLLNFIIVIFSLYYLAKKCKLIDKLEEARMKVVNTIKASEEEKRIREEEYKAETENVSHIDDEIYNALSQAEKSANALGKKMLDDANIITRGIITSTQKRIDAQINLLQADLLKKTAETSVELAKEHIIRELETKPELHDKFIYESLEALNEVQL